MTTRQSFEEAITEFIEKSREQLDEEVMENLPPDPPSPFDQSGPPYESSLRLDPKTIRNFTNEEDYDRYTNRPCKTFSRTHTESNVLKTLFDGYQ